MGRVKGTQAGRFASAWAGGLAILVFAGACKSQVGLQGGDLNNPFEGADKVYALSPTAVKLEWTKTARYASFNVYQYGINSPIKSESFSSTVVSGLQPGKTYKFAVTAVESDTGNEAGLYHFKDVTTFQRFGGIDADDLRVISPSRVDVTWTRNDPSISYLVYKKKKSDESWDWGQEPTRVADGAASTAAVTSLQGGTEYCFWVEAHYLDGTSEPSRYDANALANAPCVVTDTAMASLPQVKVLPVTLGPRPWFTVVNGADTYATDIYVTQYEGDVLKTRKIATQNKNGTVRGDFLSVYGKKKYHAIVRETNPPQGQPPQQATIPVEVDTTDATIKDTYIRMFRDGSRPEEFNMGPKFPELQADGKGVQNLGEQVVSGDFNCDGLMDIAVSAPISTPYVSPRHYQGMGAVIVYYQYDPPSYLDTETGEIVDPPPSLKTDVMPSESAAWPNPQLIYFPVTGSDVQFGRKLAVGNINGDCARRGANPMNGNCDVVYQDTVSNALDVTSVRSCDDLVVATGNTKYLYAIFGDPLQGLVSGSAGDNFGINEFTCDAGSNSCRAVRLSEADEDIGIAIALGDFNNDGFDDIATTIKRSDNTYGVRIYRGSAQGVVPSSSPRAFVSLLANGADVSGGIGAGQFMSIPDSAHQGVDRADEWPGGQYRMMEQHSFGAALAAAYNSRTCMPGTGTSYRDSNLDGVIEPELSLGYDFTKCDDLVIGIPGRAGGRGSIMTCKGVIPTDVQLAGSGGLNTSNPNKDRIIDWQCMEHFPEELETPDPEPRIVARYGAALLGVRNQNGYPVDNVLTSNPSDVSVTGALFVGAPRTPVPLSALPANRTPNAGVVYGYYITPTAADHATGGIQGILGAGAHPVEAQNSIPCDAANRNKTTGSLRHCYNQAIFNTPPQIGAQFGTALGSLPDIQNITGRGLPYLAVAAPFRDVVGTSGQTIQDLGTVYVYRPDVSTFGIEQTVPTPTQITGTQKGTPGSDDPAEGCTTACTWYSGGVNPFGPSMVYPQNLNDGSRFGWGGIAGGNFDEGTTGDLVASAYRSSNPAPSNGEVFVFYSSGSFASTENRYGLRINVNISKELNYRFEEGKVVGDLNGDGYDDVVTHIATAGEYKVVVYYGGATGLITSPPPSPNPLGTNPLLISVPTDRTLGAKFHKIGSVNCDNYDDLLLVSSTASYVFYGSFSGLIVGTPTIAPIGANPLKFGLMGPGAIGLGSNTYASRASSTYNPNNQQVGYGNFNGDTDANGNPCGDIAIGIDGGWMPHVGLPGSIDGDTGGLAYNASTGTSSADQTIDYGAAGTGRVLVIYGGPNGLQVNTSTGRVTVDPDLDGDQDLRTPATNSLQTTDPLAFEKVDVRVINPCNAATNVCKMQLLATPLSAGSAGKEYGQIVMGIPTIEGLTNEPSDELLVTDPEKEYDLVSGAGMAYFYKGGPTGLYAAPAQQLAAAPNMGRNFGYSAAVVPDINGDRTPDILISAPASSSGNQAGYVYVFYGGPVGGAMGGGQMGFMGESNIGNGPADMWASVPTVNAPIDPEAIRPQILRPPTVTAADHFGYGLAGVSDFNRDGFGDAVVNVASGLYDITETLPDAGYAIMYFGSREGLQASVVGGTGSVNPSPTPRCHGISQPDYPKPVCEPFQIFLPGREAYELMYLTRDAFGDINGDGMPDLALGGLGRRHPSGKAFSVGVIHVLY